MTGPASRRRPGPAALSLALAALLSSAPARAADVFSPGDLSRAHAGLSGLENCTRCHPAGEQLSPARCLQCHEELAPELAAGRGFHGRLPARERDCWRCHHEHLGRDAPLVDWGPGGMKGFDHASTGAPLGGGHARVACRACHDARLVRDPAVKALLSRHPSRRTFLGAPAPGACGSCHFDEHRGQLGADCRRCHTDAGWRPARGFDHARAAFPLAGKHAAVGCAKCHPREPAPPPERSPLVGPVSAAAVVRYRPVEHASCRDCHRDPHEGRFGPACVRCHTAEGWKQVTEPRAGPAERAFHERTRYPLRGAHAAVACAACHGPFPGVPARFRGLAFGACADCHPDAHGGQLAREGPAGAACERCHDGNGFTPARFGLEEHQRSRFKLEGAHRAVACAACHRRDPALAERFALRAGPVHRAHRERFSGLVLAIGGDLRRCETCHADPHAGQLARPGGCADCHDTAGFGRARFDHARDSRFALTGRHAQAPCAACHRSEASGAGEVVRYRPLATTCAGCHADPHVGQLGGDCGRCHGTEGWRPTRFQHRPPFTSYELTGEHARLECARCHAEVRVAPGVSPRRYRPLPRACEGCHADFHRGAFAGFEPDRLLLGPRDAGAGARDLRVAPGPAGGDTRCERCHTTGGWQRVAFAHERTGFPLRGAHVRVSCKGCHVAGFARPLGRSCSRCHRDVHLGRLGARCASCHDEASWRTPFDADAHRRGNFPLTGRHAFLPCEECHGDRRDLGFSRSTPACVACHQKDLERARGAAVDHQASGFSTRCQDCHLPWRFRDATFPQHDACFRLRGGPHAGVRCLACHRSLAGAAATGACRSGTAACTRCHSCASHPQGVAGFACQERKCYECHPFGGGASAGSGALRGTPRRRP